MKCSATSANACKESTSSKCCRERSLRSQHWRAAHARCPISAWLWQMWVHHAHVQHAKGSRFRLPSGPEIGCELHVRGFGSRRTRFAADIANGTHSALNTITSLLKCFARRASQVARPLCQVLARLLTAHGRKQNAQPDAKPQSEQKCLHYRLLVFKCSSVRGRPQPPHAEQNLSIRFHRCERAGRVCRNRTAVWSRSGIGKCQVASASGQWLVASASG